MKILIVIYLTLISFKSFSQEIENIQYVTGKLYLSLYQQADSGSQVIKSLVSGNRLEVIEIAGPYAKVITSDDKEGWVKNGFLVKKKPASILYREVKQEYEALQKEFDIINEKNNATINLQILIDNLEKENKKLKVRNDLYASQQNLQLKNSKKIDKLDDSQAIGLETFQQFINEYFIFLLSSLILLILIGFRVGQLKTESDVIKHFGGVKVW